MNIVVFGAGALGSFIGGVLAQKHAVVLIGRQQHVDTIQRQGLTISGETQCFVKPQAFHSIKEIMFFPDLILLTVKSYDTKDAAKEIQPYLKDDSVVLSLQNGLGNIEALSSIVDKKHIIAGITTHGVFYQKPGCIVHSGFGKTILGELSGKKTTRIQHIASLFSDAGIPTTVSTHIFTDIWVKAIINASINPLTAFLMCTNGYLLKNPVVEHICDNICAESTHVANAEHINVDVQKMLRQTKQVIRKTKNNYSSMVQSIQQGKKTEIDHLNQKFVDFGKKHGIETPLNTLMVLLIKSMLPKQGKKSEKR